MIFVTVGTQLPFDRLINTVDTWAQSHPDQNVFAQIGKAQHPPKHIQYARHMTPQEFDKKFQDAQIIVGHVGMGTIITGIEQKKPMILMPRQSKFGEHRNDHQVATAEHFSALPCLTIVNSLQEFDSAITELLAGDGSFSDTDIAVSEELLAAISDFVRS